MKTPDIWKDETTRWALSLIQRDGSAVGKRELKAEVDRHPENDALFGLYCGCLLWTGDREQAEPLLRDRAKARPASSTLATLALAQWMAGDNDAAKRTIEAAGKIDPADYLYLRHASDFVSVDAQDDRFEDLMSRAEALYPGDPWAYGKRFTHNLTRGRLDEARRLLNDASPEFKSLPMFHNHWGMLYLHERNIEAMEEQYRYAVAASPENAQYWGYLSMALRHLGRFDEAVVAADNALDLDPTNRFALETHAKVAQRKGDSATAKVFEDRRSAAMPGVDLRESREASKRLHAGDVRGAIAVHRKVLKDPKAKPTARRTAENCLLDLYSIHSLWSDSRKLLDSMRAGGRLSEPRHDALLAETDFQQGVTGALERLEAISKSADPPGIVYLALIRAYLKTGDRQSLSATIDRLRADLPSYPEPLVHAVFALYKANEKDLADALFEEIKRKRPHLTALQYYEVVRAVESGDRNRARHLFRGIPVGERLPRKSVFVAIFRRIFARKK